MHAWDGLTPLEETLRFLDDAVRAGKVHYVGLSNFTGWQVQKVVALARELGLSVPVTLQPQYNLLAREVELEVVPSCLDTGLGLLPWSPLGGGWLTGKYRRDQAPTGATRLGEDPARGMEAYGPRSAQERTWDVVGAVEAVASARGASMAQVALAWLSQQPSVTSVILGARTTEQLTDNLGALTWCSTPRSSTASTPPAVRRSATTPTARRPSSSAPGPSPAAAPAEEPSGASVLEERLRDPRGPPRGRRTGACTWRCGPSR